MTIQIRVSPNAIKAAEPNALVMFHDWARDPRRYSEIRLLDGQGNIVATVKYRPENPRDDGTRAWIEVETDVCQVEADERLTPVTVTILCGNCDAAIWSGPPEQCHLNECPYCHAKRTVSQYEA